MAGHIRMRRKNAASTPDTDSHGGANAPSSTTPRDAIVTRVRGGQTRALIGYALVASALGSVLSVFGRLFLGIMTPAEIFGDRLTAFVPLPIFSSLLTLFGTNAKHLYYGGVLVLEVLLTAVAGTVYILAREKASSYLARRRPSWSLPRFGWYDSPFVMVWLWLLSAGILAPVLGGGLFGASLVGGAGGLVVAELLPDAVFAICFVLLLRRAATKVTSRVSEAEESVTRRRLLRQAGVAVAVLAGGGLIWELFSSGITSIFGIGGSHLPHVSVASAPGRIVPPPVPSYGPWVPVSGETAEVTPTASFYYVSKNLAGDPQIGQDSWKLSISGHVSAPYNLSYAELRALPKVERYHTLECISNEVGGNLISNAYFTGVRLADVLNMAGIQSGADEMIFRAADDYSDSLHLSQALNPDALIVYLINGQPLPQEHGFPARLLIPGLYGMKNGKWLTALEVGTGQYTGYWEQRGWTREARVKMMSRVDVPHDGDLLVAGTTYIAGVAYAADQGIARIDVSTDGGRTWRPATLRRPLGNLTWVLWELTWQATSGRHVIAVRAIDLQGNVQTPTYAPPLPDGSSGYDAVSVVVR